jgi:hypothetical protein
MKRKNRKSAPKRKVQRKKHAKIRRTTRRSRKESRANAKRPVALRKRKSPADARVFLALRLMRNEGSSASAAARRAGIKLETLVRRTGNTLYRSGPGKPWKARTRDQLAATMNLLTDRGRLTVVVRNSRERKLLHQYESALRMFRAGEDGAEQALKEFEGKTVGGHKLITDTKLLIELEEAGQLDFENLYSSFGAGS